MRLFKVYEADEGAEWELIFARNHREAASITKTLWQENGYVCCCFEVVELCLPASAKEGRQLIGLVYEPAIFPKEYRL